MQRNTIITRKNNKSKQGNPAKKLKHYSIKVEGKQKLNKLSKINWMLLAFLLRLIWFVFSGWVCNMFNMWVSRGWAFCLSRHRIKSCVVIIWSTFYVSTKQPEKWWGRGWEPVLLGYERAGACNLTLITWGVSKSYIKWFKWYWIFST